MGSLTLLGSASAAGCTAQTEGDELDDRTCSAWAPGHCGRPDGCFAPSGSCEFVYNANRECVDGSWEQVDSCDGGGGDGGGECQPWSQGRCRMPDGCFVDPGVCADVYGGPRNCENGNWVTVPVCSGGDGGGGDGGDPSDAPPLLDYGVGLDPGALVRDDGHVWFHDNTIFDAGEGVWRTNADLIAMAGAQYARVDFIRPDGWSNEEFFALYDPLIDEIIDDGMIPYALVGAAAVDADFPMPWVQQQGGTYVAAYNEGGQRAWITGQYAPTFEAVVEHFGDRIRAFESFNEPDNWFLKDPNDVLLDSPPMRPHIFAELVHAVHAEVKEGGSNPDAVLITGPLVGHDHGGFSAAANYLNLAIDHGQAHLGWSGSFYPFDGVGYHVYVEQHTDNGWGVESDVASSIDAMYDMLEDELGTELMDRHGDLWISEFGWATPNLSDADQSAALQTAFGYFRGQRHRIRMASWYQVVDTPSEGGFGLARPNYLHSAENQARFKASWDTFVQQAGFSAP